MINLESLVKTIDGKYGIVKEIKMSLKKQIYSIKIFGTLRDAKILDYEIEDLEETTIRKIELELIEKYGLDASFRKI